MHELEGAELDAAVAKAEGESFRVDIDESGVKSIRVLENVVTDHGAGAVWIRYSPSTDWNVGGPIIHREQISLISPDDQLDLAWRDVWTGRILGVLDGSSSFAERHGATPLIAAMRAFVASFEAEK